jgi:alpha-glucosidase
MAGFNLFRVLQIVSLRMIIRGIMYTFRTATRVVKAENPGLRGLALRRAVLRALSASHTPELAPPENLQGTGLVISAAYPEPHVATLQTTQGGIRITALADDLIELHTGWDGQRYEEPFSYSLERPPSTWEGASLQHSETGDQIVLGTSALAISADKASGYLSIQAAGGRALLEEIRAFRQQAGQQIGWQARFAEEAVFYGLGEKASGLNHAGRQFELWNTDPAGYPRDTDPIYMSIPFLVALSEGQAVGVFIDNPYRAWVSVGAARSGQVTFRALGGELRVYIMAGSPKQVLERYTALAGRMKLPPLWALGFHQSRWSYYPQERVLEIAREFRRRRLPCDVIHLDIHYMDDYRCFTWDSKRFPAPRRMTEELHAEGFKALSMIDPGIKVDPGYAVYDEGLRRGAFMTYPDGAPFTGPVWPGDCHFPDFTNPAVREWWGELYRGLLDDGIDAFWNDMNEIALITTLPFGSKYVPDIVRHGREGKGASHAEIHNVYGMLMARASREGLARLRPDRRPLILTRSGWAGVQRYAIHWTGDNQSTWDHLRLTIPMVLNLGFSGVALTGPDTGGFTGGPSAELFARWMQLGAVTPFFRVHSMAGSPDQEPWAFGPEVEAISRKYLELRYRLLPYLYTAVWQAAQSGWPIMRSLSFAFPADRETYSIEDQFMLGDALLAAPVLEEGAIRRKVYLPAGAWYDFWNGERLEGGQAITTDAPLDHLPLFVRAGAAIPLWPIQQFVGEKTIERLTLRVYAAAGESYNLHYEDDGACPDYEASDRHRLSCWKVSGEGQRLALERQIVSGSYAPAPYRTLVEVYGLGSTPGAVSASGGILVSQGWDAQTQQFTAEVEAGGAFSLSMD